MADETETASLDFVSDYGAALVSSYEGEVAGEAYFKGLRQFFAGKAERRKLALLAAIENETASLLRLLLVRHRLSWRDDAVLHASGMQDAGETPSRLWRPLMAEFAESFAPYLRQFRALERAAPPEDRPVLALLTAHEEALIEFATRELAGSDASLEPVMDYQERCAQFHAQPFWRRKTLAEMTEREWESLCDGCGRCCLLKLEDADTGELFHTDVTCRLLDLKTCRCRSYRDRQTLVLDCVKVTPDNIVSLHFMPSTCAYRVLAEGNDLAWWHPLVSGRRETVYRAGISVRHRVIGEDEIDEEDLPKRIVTWPR